MRPVFIYALNDPITGVVRYCGQTIDPDVRLRKHICEARKEKYHCPCWINSLLKKKLQPIMEILDVVPDSEADFWEREYIQNFRERGFDLTNITPGGEAGPILSGARNPNFGKNCSGEKNTFFGKKHTSATLEKMSIAKKGCLPWNAGLKCPALTLAHRKKLIIAQRLRREKEKEMGGVKQETLEKMSAARKAWHARNKNSA